MAEKRSSWVAGGARALWSALAAGARRVDPAVTRWLEWLARAEPVYGLAGPLFEKELRVGGRRLRTYILRFLYMCVLSSVVGMFWLGMVTTASMARAPVFYAYQMSEAGKGIICAILWFQFVALQPVAVVMLSTAISDEIYQRTLGVLLTTPITSLQIVAGKLLGRLLQLGLLVAISLPMLLVVRALGGVPWRFVGAGLALTLATTLTAACISLHFSIRSRRSPVLVILKSAGAMVGLFLVLPLVWNGFRDSLASPEAWDELVGHANPYLVLGGLTAEMFTPGAARPQWAGTCLMLLGVSAGLVAVSVVRVRRAAMRQLIGEEGGWWRRWRGRSGRVRRVRGSPVVWKELRASVLSSRAASVAGWALVIGLLLGTYALVGAQNAWGEGWVHAVYGTCLLVLLGLSASVVTATGIAKEKEAGTWPILLATPLEDAQIVAGKATALVRRCLPAWLLLMLHFAIFVGTGRLHPVVLVHMGLVGAGVVALLAGSGLFFSTLVRRTTYAILLNLGLCVGLWGALPVAMLSVASFASLVFVAGRGPMGKPWPITVWLSAHPITQTIVVVLGAVGEGAAVRRLADLRYDWVGVSLGLVPATFLVLAVALMHAILGWLMASWAARRLRTRVF